MPTRWLSESAGNRLELDQNDDNDESSEKYFRNLNCIYVHFDAEIQTLALDDIG